MIGGEGTPDYVPSWRRGTTGSPAAPSRRYRPPLTDEARSGSAYADPWRLNQGDENDHGDQDDVLTAADVEAAESPEPQTPTRTSTEPEMTISVATRRVKPVKPNEWMEAIVNCPDVTGGTLLVGLLMARHASWETGTSCFPSQARIAAQIGNKDTRSLRDHLAVLREDGLGWLTRRGFVESGPHKGNLEYWLTVPDCGHLHDGTALRRIGEAHKTTG